MPDDTKREPSEAELEAARTALLDITDDDCRLRDFDWATRALAKHFARYADRAAQPAAAEVSDREAAVLVVTNDWDNYALAEAVRWARTGERSTVITADFVREVEQLEPHFKRHRSAHAQGAGVDLEQLKSQASVVCGLIEMDAVAHKLEALVREGEKLQRLLYGEVRGVVGVEGCKHSDTWQLERYSFADECSYAMKWCADCGSLCEANGPWRAPIRTLASGKL